ncbi:hypothetical protein J8I87_19480 [Paraburkholderia sp. LEh10]|nr:hypothetical protein [Paraburkholderia sp. LEh10]MBP0591867.1 hypothetical protein [Paraburkholderia sp. LEh10]
MMRDENRRHHAMLSSTPLHDTRAMRIEHARRALVEATFDATRQAANSR